MRKITGNMSDVEERILMALYALTAPIYQRQWKRPFFAGSGVGEMLGGKWTSYRHKTMKKLEGLKWVTCEKVQTGGTRQWTYQLTEQGYATLAQRASKALYFLPENKENLF